MHSASSIALTFKARVLGSTSAQVRLAGTDQGTKRFARAITRLENSEHAMYRRHWKGKLSAQQLLAGTHRLAQLRMQLRPSTYPIRLACEVNHLLVTCSNRRPLNMSDRAPPVQALRVFLDPDAVSARACNALTAAFWRGELNDFERFRMAFKIATEGGESEPEHAAALHRAAVNALYDSTPKVGQGREVKLLESFIARLVPAPSGHNRSDSITSRVAREDRADWWETAMFGYGTDSESGDDGSSVQDSGWETDDSGFSVVVVGDEAYV